MPHDRDDGSPPDGGNGEEALIAAYWAPLAEGDPGALGLKDDCALLAPAPGEDLVITTDALIEGVHFLPDEDPAAIGWKALAVNVSDLVAKGAEPKAYLLSIALPAADPQWLAAFSAGLGAAQKAFGCHLIGGDTDRTPGLLSVAITVFGAVPAGRMIRRGTARPGDEVYVSGTIGDAHLGLLLAQAPQAPQLDALDTEARSSVRQHFSRPRPPVELIPMLRALAGAAMDISDGLVKDLSRLCSVSGVGAQIESARIPLSPAGQAALAAGLPLEALMTGGEDYGVLFTVSRDRRAEVEAWAGKSAERITRIGEITADRRVSVLDPAGRALQFKHSGWHHFRDSGTR